MNNLSEQLQGLYDGYLGDDAWEKFVSNFPEIDDSIKKAIPLDDDLLRVLYRRNNNKMKLVNEYLAYKVPIFDKFTPLEVFALPEGRVILRSAFMRMH